jgi:hypothetical protein
MEEAKGPKRNYQPPVLYVNNSYNHTKLGDEHWRGNYVRAQIAGRVIEPSVFPLVAAAVAKGDETDFAKICRTVMTDLDETFRENIIKDMWLATMASRNANQYKICW